MKSGAASRCESQILAFCGLFADIFDEIHFFHWLTGDSRLGGDQLTSYLHMLLIWRLWNFLY